MGDDRSGGQFDGVAARGQGPSEGHRERRPRRESNHHRSSSSASRRSVSREDETLRHGRMGVSERRRSRSRERRHHDQVGEC